MPSHSVYYLKCIKKKLNFFEDFHVKIGAFSRLINVDNFSGQDFKPWVSWDYVTKNVSSAVFTFIEYRQTDNQTNKPSLFKEESNLKIRAGRI